MIETTIYCSRRILRITDTMAIKHGLSRSAIVILFVNKAMRNKSLYLHYNRTVKYQGDNGSENWFRMHIRMNEMDYECCLDMRKFCKLSVSFLIALSIDCYKDEIENELNELNVNKTDNYQIKNYLILKEDSENVTCWKIYWIKHTKGSKQKQTIILEH